MKIITLVSGNVDEGGKGEIRLREWKRRGKDWDTFQIPGQSTSKFPDSHSNCLPILSLGNGAKLGHSSEAHHFVQERDLAHGFIPQD